jgi:hypothetical protein
MGESAQGPKVRKDEARPGATPGWGRSKDPTGLDLDCRSAAHRASGPARSLSEAPSNSTHRPVRSDTLRRQPLARL